MFLRSITASPHVYRINIEAQIGAFGATRNHVKTANYVEEEDNSDEDIADDFGVVNQENIMEEGMARSSTKILISMNLTMG
ncbi:hypothetical protein NC653_018953 [Populus alba x Populus x berolinensis]|uniref:Uncharacterized protein n=1 Tax=Populus alba x Populus x berolinensis TaxID=444605 RepID=A0AAD6QHM1_9ROSI|nr:hypothetical protein NC653_018953 [Populus alba x Populus x berolinensis]